MDERRYGRTGGLTMKKVDVSFVCDKCGNSLPGEFVGKNNSGQPFFDLHKYNTIRMGLGCEISLDITVKIAGTDQKELCPKCRVKTLRGVINRLESELKEV